jgi:hypothetical protein
MMGLPAIVWSEDEQWANLEEKTIKNYFFCFYYPIFHDSSIPSSHVVGIN